MDSFEWNKIIGAVLGTAILIFVIRLVAEKVYEPEIPAKPGYVVEGVEATPGAGATAPVEEPVPDWGTVLASANTANGKSVSARCEQCHDISNAKQSKIGPPLWGVIGRPRASVPGFSYSSAMMSDHTAWAFTSLFKYLKSPATIVPGTKMSFAGLRAAQDRIDLIAFLRTQSDSPVAIPPPAPPPAAAPAEAAAAGDKAAPAGDKTAAPAPAAKAKPANNAAGKSGPP
jgi:cytochrome c